MKKDLVKIAENSAVRYYVSVIEWATNKYEIAVIKEFKNSKGMTDIDYTLFNDVVTVESLMQVYGLVEYEIKPFYQELTDWKKF